MMANIFRKGRKKFETDIRNDITMIITWYGQAECLLQQCMFYADMADKCSMCQELLWTTLRIWMVTSCWILKA